ncbi:5-carboxymethyl-2-hydroxymuconate Delta-isomerase [Vibrio paucivorans]
MPHCIIEHSPSIDSNALNQLVFKGAMASKLFAPDGSDIKVRSLVYQSYQSGGRKQEFVHVSAKILSGRSEADKCLLSQCILKQLLELGLADASLTVEVVDIDRASYTKQIV